MSVPAGDAALPHGFHFRAPTFDDLPSVVDIWRAEETAIDGAARTQESEIRTYWSDPERTIAEENRVVVDEDDRVVAILDTYDYPPYTTAEFGAAVHPEFWGRGIGSALVTQFKAYTMARIARVQEPRLAMHSQLSSRNERAHALLQRHGFRHIRDWRVLEIDLTDTAGRVVPPEGLRLAILRRDVDERRIWEAAEDAWQDHFGYAPFTFEEFTYYRIDSNPAFDPGLWIIALDENTDEIAGISLSRNDTTHGDEMGWVSQLAVRRPWRGRGLGTVLLQAAFAAFRERGWTRAGLSVDASSTTGADRLYERAGMHRCVASSSSRRSCATARSRMRNLPLRPDAPHRHRPQCVRPCEEEQHAHTPALSRRGRAAAARVPLPRADTRRSSGRRGGLAGGGSGH